MNKTILTPSILLMVIMGALWAYAHDKSTVNAVSIVGDTTELPVWLAAFDPGEFRPLVFNQQAVQVGVECVAVPQCPDCTKGGNVCRGAREFYGGLIGAAVAKKSIIAKCKEANNLDYCGGSTGCMKLSLQDQKRYREQRGGGCYPQCEKVAKCVVQYRNP